jgi:hypothetical protein
MINDKNISELKTLCYHISLDRNNKYYFDQDLIDLNLIDVPADLTLVEKVHTLCDMINKDNSILDKDFETEICIML